MEISSQMNIMNTSKLMSTSWSRIGSGQPRPYRFEAAATCISSCRQGQGQGQGRSNYVGGMQRQSGKTNFYKVLSLDSGDHNAVSVGEIKKAYRRLALQFHPDVCPHHHDPSAKEESTQRFIELQMAYQTLSDPVSRQIHDYELGLVDYHHHHHAINYTTTTTTTTYSSCMDQEIRIRSKFPRHVWEKQLYGLKKRSQVRIQRMKNRST